VDFGFNADQELLRATTRRFLDDLQPLSALRERIEGPNPFDSKLWRKGAELGWTAMLVPPAHEGGSVTDQPLVDLVVLAEELGRTLNPGPFIGTNVVADAVARFGSERQASAHLAPIARGETVAAWCMSADGVPDASSVEVLATPTAGGWRLDGVARYIHAAQDADLLLVTATDGAGGLKNLLVTVPASGVKCRPMAGLDLTRRFAEVSFDDVVVDDVCVVEGGHAIFERALAIAGVLTAAQAVGAADHLFNATVGYTRDRIQFGRPIASFQAIKHRLADLLIELEAMRAATHYAALALGDDLSDAPEAVATAGAYVGDAFAHLCGEALQLHGGIGFTWEHDVHLYLRRAKVDQVLYGDGAWHRERLCRLTEVAMQGKS
jgi:alkylation response protein AidB-like acyl-CoA dehydrogenase